MKKSIKKIAALLIFSSLLCTGYARPQAKTAKEEDFLKVLDKINKSRREDDKKDIKFDSKYANWFKDESELSENDFNTIIRCSADAYSPNKIKFDSSKVISASEAKEDLNTLSNLFRYCYAGYGYFGGDESFFKAKENVMKELNKKETLLAGDFVDLLVDNFYFIKDGHFGFSPNSSSGKTLSPNIIYYINNSVDFFRDEKGYYKIINNIPYYIESINDNKAIEQYMKLTINDEGKLVYTIAELHEGKNIFNVSINELSMKIKYLYDENKIFEESCSLHPLNRVEPSNGKTGEGYVFSVDNNGIPTHNLRRLKTISKEDKFQEDFIKSTDKFKEYPVNILDIRETTGGVWGSVAEWIHNYTGESLNYKSTSMCVNSKVLKKVIENSYGFSYPGSLFAIDKCDEATRGKNDNLIFMLIDKKNASASELSIRAIKQVDNVILVGSNTYGAELTLDILSYQLKNSRCFVTLGSALAITHDKHGFDLKGFEPDILVDSKKSEEKVKKLIDYYKINTHKNK